MVNLAQTAFLTAAASAHAALAITYAFPNCKIAPLSGNAVCDVTKDALTRAKAIVSLFTDAELAANTVNGSPGVSRLGLPAYEWWSEALVSFVYFLFLLFRC